MTDAQSYESVLFALNRYVHCSSYISYIEVDMKIN